MLKSYFEMLMEAETAQSSRTRKSVFHFNYIKWFFHYASILPDLFYFNQLKNNSNFHFYEAKTVFQGAKTECIRNWMLTKVFHLSRLATQMNSLDGKVAVVTGASSGFGRAIALLLGEHGARLAVAARRQEKLDELVAELQGKGIEAIAVKTDVSKLQEVEELHRQVELSLGPVDILVNNAGYMFYTEMQNQAYKEWEKTINANIWGTTNCIGVMLPGMIKGGKGGHIVNMSSDAGKRGFGGLAVYSGTKFYIEGLSQSLRAEVAKHRIKVTCIEPGKFNNFHSISTVNATQ